MLVMQLVEGPSLADWLQNEPKSWARTLAFPAKNCARSWLQVADGLAAAHQLHTIHRDIKPANILIDQQRQLAKITDFGLAFTWKPSRKYPLHSPGTPQYMSPEQLLGSPQLDQRSDIYSLGVTLFEALTGQLPFSGDFPELFAKVTSEQSATFSDSSAIDLDLQAICLKALQKDPNNRYASVAKFGQDLRRWLQGKSVFRSASWMGAMWFSLVAATCDACFLCFISHRSVRRYRRSVFLSKSTLTTGNGGYQETVADEISAT